VIIAGGGIGGLCYGHELTKLGHDVTVLEAAGRTGGHVRTIRDPLADGLYVDGGAEHFTKPGYELFWGHVAEFGLKPHEYHRRENMLRLINGKLHTEEMLADPKVLAGFGLNQREVDFLAREPWWNLASLYFTPYLDSFKDDRANERVDRDFVNTYYMWRSPLNFNRKSRARCWQKMPSA